MKKLGIYLMILFCIAATPFALQSCDDDGYSLNDFAVSMATVKVISDNVYYLEIDNGRKLWVAASDVYWYRPVDGQRVLANYTILGDRTGEYDHSVKVNYLSSVLTKTVERLTEANEAEYGNDKVLIEEMWIGGNYLNIQFRYFLPYHYRHRVSLVENTIVENPEDGYIYLEYRYNDQDDVSNVWSRSLVSFYLGDYAPGVAAANYKGIVVTINSAKNGFRPIKFNFNSSEENERTLKRTEELDPTEGKVE